jgi:hypothetical protein
MIQVFSHLTPILFLFLSTVPAFAQSPVVQERPPSPKIAFVRSLALPGWGHQYAQGGSWRGKATLFAGAELGLWLGLANSIWQRNHIVQNYETLAATQAHADISGKDRRFFLNLASYQSSDEYLAAQLRNRAWDRIDYVDDPAFQWAWETEDDFFTFREMREDAETLRRRRSLFVALLVANRLLAGLSSIQTANKAGTSLSLSLGAPPTGANHPMLQAQIGF